MNPLPFDAILCDLDGVVRHWDPAILADLEVAYGLATGTLATALFHPARLLPAITGQVSDAQWRAGIAEDLHDLCGSAVRARALVEAWSLPVGRVDTDVLAILAAARAHVPVALVTNATTRLEDDLAALGLTDQVDAIVNTSRIGVAKPDPRVYQHAAAIVGVEPTRCLFVDDQAENVDAARAAGMTGLLYAGPHSLREALAPLPI
jgi:putative hydrolase of the HAD superfamily